MKIQKMRCSVVYIFKACCSIGRFSTISELQNLLKSENLLKRTVCKNRTCQLGFKLCSYWLWSVCLSFAAFPIKNFLALSCLVAIKQNFSATLLTRWRNKLERLSLKFFLDFIVSKFPNETTSLVRRRLLSDS
jgi:hypothetical protein